MIRIRIYFEGQSFKERSRKTNLSISKTGKCLKLRMSRTLLNNYGIEAWRHRHFWTLSQHLFPNAHLDRSLLVFLSPFLPPATHNILTMPFIPPPIKQQIENKNVWNSKNIFRPVSQNNQSHDVRIEFPGKWLEK